MALPAKHSYLMGGTFNSAAPILIDGDTSPFQLDSSGNLLVNVAAGTITATNPSVGLTGTAAPTSATEIGVVDSTGKLQHVTGLDLINAFAVTVAIVDGNGNQITSFGGGTQYADDAASGVAPTGTLSMGWDSANSKIRALKVDASQNLLVDATISSTAQAPLLVPVSTSSVSVLASNSSRKGCTITNLSFSTISLAFGGTAAVLFTGLTLGPGGTFWMDSQDFTTAGINAIASDTEGNLAIQEFD